MEGRCCCRRSLDGRRGAGSAGVRAAASGFQEQKLGIVKQIQSSRCHHDNVLHEILREFRGPMKARRVSERNFQRESPPSDALIISTAVNQSHGWVPAGVPERLMVPWCCTMFHCSHSAAPSRTDLHIQGADATCHG